MIRTIIIDDEAHIRDTLTRLLESSCPQVSVVGEASGVSMGIKMIQTLKPDLVLLDINMKDGTGFDLLNAFPDKDFKVIFVSALDKKTIQVFKQSNIPYLQKPVSPLELSEVIKKSEKIQPGEMNIMLAALETNIKTYP